MELLLNSTLSLAPPEFLSPPVWWGNTVFYAADPSPVYLQFITESYSGILYSGRVMFNPNYFTYYGMRLTTAGTFSGWLHESAASPAIGAYYSGGDACFPADGSAAVPRTTTVLFSCAPSLSQLSPITADRTGCFFRVGLGLSSLCPSVQPHSSYSPSASYLPSAFYSAISSRTASYASSASYDSSSTPASSSSSGQPRLTKRAIEV